MLFTFQCLSTHPSNPAKQILDLLMGSFLYFIYPTQFLNNLGEIFWNREFHMQNYRSSQAWTSDTCETIFVPGAICSTEPFLPLLAPACPLHLITLDLAVTRAIAPICYWPFTVIVLRELFLRTGGKTHNSLRSTSGFYLTPSQSPPLKFLWTLKGTLVCNVALRRHR